MRNPEVHYISGEIKHFENKRIPKRFTVDHSTAFNPLAVGISNLKRSTSIIRNWLFSMLFTNKFQHLNFSDEQT